MRCKLTAILWVKSGTWVERILFSFILFIQQMRWNFKVMWSCNIVTTWEKHVLILWYLIRIAIGNMHIKLIIFYPHFSVPSLPACLWQFQCLTALQNASDFFVFIFLCFFIKISTRCDNGFSRKMFSILMLTQSLLAFQKGDGENLSVCSLVFIVLDNFVLFREIASNKMWGVNELRSKIMLSPHKPPKIGDFYTIFSWYLSPLVGVCVHHTKIGV